jgi:hypothetical protein
MTTQYETKLRRDKVSECLSKGLHSPALIVKKLEKDFKIPPGDHQKFYKRIDNDLRWMRKDSIQWLQGHTLDGYVYETRMAISQLRDIESELQEMREKQKEGGEIPDRLKIMAELKDTINLRWVMQGDGPTLMNLNLKHGKDTQNSKQTK